MHHAHASLNYILFRCRSDVDKSNLKASKFILLKRTVAFDKAKKDFGEMKGTVKTVEAVSGRLSIVIDNGEKLELKVQCVRCLVHIIGRL
jgi:hypothetical protein